MKFKSPHFFRGIHARLISSLEMALLWTALVALFAINIWSIQKSRPAYWDKLMMLFQTPFSAPVAVNLASFLWKTGEREEARSLAVAAGFGQVLGAWEQDDRRVAQEYAFWQSVVASHPDYRDAFIQLATLAYQLGKLDEARAALTRAQSLDPNSPTIHALVSFLQ